MALTAGIVLGAVAAEGFNVYRQSHDSRIFQERVHCKAVADAYVKANSTDVKASPTDTTFVSVTLDKADYSPARNSCVAELEAAYVAPPASTVFESVQDLLSGETLFSVRCTGDCEVEKSTFVNRAFDYVMNNTSEPIELEKEWALMESKSPPKSALPPGAVQIDPQTGERVPKSPPKPAPPSGR